MSDTSESVAVGLLFGTTAIFGWELATAFKRRARYRVPKKAKMPFIDKLAAAAVVCGAAYYAIELNYRLYQTLVEGKPLPEELGG